MTSAMPPDNPGPNSTDGSPRIAHVGIAVESLAAILPFFRDVLGMPEVPMSDSDGARIAAVQSGESLIEFLEPAAPDTPIGKYVAKRGAGIQLIDEAPRLGAEGKRIAFLHPKSTGGILVELTEQ